MGDPKKEHKKYKTPETPFDEARQKEELILIGTYGLRNKKELWIHRTRLTNFRSNAREILSLEENIRIKREIFS